jgi:hypothetical protein
MSFRNRDAPTVQTVRERQAMFSTNLQTIAFDQLGLVTGREGERGSKQMGSMVDGTAGQLASRELGGQAGCCVDRVQGNLLRAVRQVVLLRAARARTHVLRTFVVVRTGDVRSSQVSA